MKEMEERKLDSKRQLHMKEWRTFVRTKGWFITGPGLPIPARHTTDSEIPRFFARCSGHSMLKRHKTNRNKIFWGRQGYEHYRMSKYTSVILRLCTQRHFYISLCSFITVSGWKQKKIDLKYALSCPLHMPQGWFVCLPQQNAMSILGSYITASTESRWKYLPKQTDKYL
jgi:hypothetical protein